MIGLVIVSHSHRLAEGVKELAQQMGPNVPIAAAGGLDDDTIGTSFERIAQALDTVDSPDGVLVLMDLGSAVLTTETVLDMLDEARRARVRLSNAPLVEGAVAAATVAALGEPLAAVAAAARSALSAPKVETDEAVAPTPPPAVAAAPSSAVPELVLTIPNRIGLHLRPAKEFVQAVGRFDADVRVRNLSRDKGLVDGKSMFGLLGLNARLGDQIGVTASGPQAAAALAAVRELVEAGFGEELGAGPPQAAGAAVAPPPSPAVPSPAPAPSAAPVSLAPAQGISASPGIAVGPAYLYRAGPVQPARYTLDDPAAEWPRLEAALAQAQRDLAALAERTERRVGRAEAQIFAAHQQILADPALLDAARLLIQARRLNAEAALFDAAEDLARQLEGMDDDVLRQRAVDVRDVCSRVLGVLAGPTAPRPTLTTPSILIARDLTPSETAQLDPAQVLGIATALGGATSHTAILARTLGVPAVVGLGEAILHVQEATPLVVDGTTGQVWVDPDEATLARYQEQQQRELNARAAALAQAGLPALTIDGRPVNVWANVGDAVAARRAYECGAEGVGLLRTEFLFLDRATPPSEEEQVQAYRAVAEALRGRPVTVRTLDIGGDKPAPYLDLPAEDNPFLGQRAIRLCLAHPDLFRTQLRAILRVAADFPLKLMFPMIATLEELVQAKAQLAQARAELEAVGTPFGRQLDVGIMVEIPAAALTADALAAEADFFSLGTNDLVQYTFAVDRGNPAVSALGQAVHPAILRQIDRVVRAAHEMGRTVSVCGEMGSDAHAIPLLVGLGVDTLSVNPAAVPPTKALVRQLHWAETQERASAWLS